MDGDSPILKTFTKVCCSADIQHNPGDLGLSEVKISALGVSRILIRRTTSISGRQ
jgi:hypothetical protein